MKETEVFDRLKELRKVGDLGEAETLMLGWSDSTGQRADRFYALTALYVFASSEGYFDKALEYALAQLEMDESDTTALTLVGEAYRLKGEPEKAETHLRRALELAEHTDDVNVYFDAVGLAWVLLEQGRFDECEALALTDYSSRTPSYISPPPLDRLYLLASLYRQTGRTELAVECLRKLLREPIDNKQFIFIARRMLLKELADTLSSVKQE